MQQKIEYINNGKILVRIVRGKADFDQIYSSWLELINSNVIQASVTGIINDFRDMELDMKISDVKKLLLLFESNIEVFESLKIAVVVDSFKNIVFPMVGEKFSSKIDIRSFSTFNAARDWILDSIY